MKTVKLFFPLLLLAVILTFAYQNLDDVNVTFIFWSITVPFSLTIFLSFIIGVLAGGMVFIFLRNKKKDDKYTEQPTDQGKFITQA